MSATAQNPLLQSLNDTGRMAFGKRDAGPAWSLTAVGDTIPYAPLAQKLSTEGKAVFGDVPALLTAELRYCNWEGAIGAVPPEKLPNMLPITCTPEAARLTAEGLGFNVFCLANNHAADLGPQGVCDTLHLLSRYGTTHGAGRNEREARAAGVRAPVPGIRVGFLAYSWIFDNYATADRPGIAPRRTEIILADIARERPKVDVLVVSLHQGYEFTPLPRPISKRLVHRCIAAGADLVLGHDPHVPQGCERIGEGFAVYSLGNFFFDVEYHRNNPWTRIGPIWRFEFRGKTLVGASVTPVELTLQNKLARLDEARTREVWQHLATLSADVADDEKVAAFGREFCRNIGNAIFRQVYRMGLRDDKAAFEFFQKSRRSSDATVQMLRDYLAYGMELPCSLDDI